MRVQLISGRSLGQGRGKEKGKYSQDYVQSTSICEIDPEDLKSLHVKEDENVLIKTDFGQAILKPVASKQAPHPGVIFISYGPWVNKLTDPQTHGSGMPSLKGVIAEISVTKNPVSRM